MSENGISSDGLYAVDVDTGRSAYLMTSDKGLIASESDFRRINDMEESKMLHLKAQTGLRYTVCGAILISLIAGCGGGGGGDGEFSGDARVSGRALAPSDGATTTSTRVPVANAPVSIRDFVDSRTVRVIQVGMTDADGNFDVTLDRDGGAIIVNGDVNGSPVRVSGLVKQTSDNVQKDFDETTDIACQAYFNALDAGELSPGDLTNSRIANLEQGAADFLANNPINIFDPNAVSAAASSVRNSTGNGASAPGAPAATPTPDTGSGLNCQTTESSCADGTPVCAELVCNGTQDCADGSDEDPAICGEQSACCQATNGCPGESATECSAECCCCDFGEICDQGNNANGCVAARVTGRSRFPELEKVIGQEVYY